MQIGEWLKVNGEAVYGTTASPFWPRQFDWGTISAKPGKLYLHIHNPELGQIEIKGFKVQISDANLLHTTGEIPVSLTNENGSVSLEWPSYLNDNAVTVIELDVQKGFKTDITTRQFSNGNIEFNCWAMKVHGEKAHAHYDGYGNRLRMLDWTDPKEYLTADIIIEKSGIFDVSLIYGATKGDKANEFLDAVQGTAGGKFTFKIGDKSINCEIQDTGNSNKPEPIEVGKIKIDNPGKYELSIQPIDNGNWNGFRFQGVEMKLKN
jgi:alpha-L-fucosidase